MVKNEFETTALDKGGWWLQKVPSNLIILSQHLFPAISEKWYFDMEEYS